MKENNIYVESEFAPLRKVVLTQSQFAFPKNMKDSSFLTEENINEFRKNEGKDFADAFPKEQLKWEEERENLKKVLEKYNVEVCRPRLLTDYEKEVGGDDGYSNFFARDPFFTIGNIIIEGSLRFPHRRNEILPIRNILVDESNKNNCFYLSIPSVDFSQGIDSEVGPFLEGGDILVLGKTIFVGNSGLASNKRGINWLKNLLYNFDYTLVEVPLANDVLHLDCALSIVREDLIIVCEEALLNGIPKELEKFDKIRVSKEHVNRLAVNGLQIDRNTYITDPEFEFIGKQLEQRGITVEYIDFKISRSFGGSFRCSTQPLLRK